MALMANYAGRVLIMCSIITVTLGCDKLFIPSPRDVLTTDGHHNSEGDTPQ